MFWHSTSLIYLPVSFLTVSHSLRLCFQFTVINHMGFFFFLLCLFILILKFFFSDQKIIIYFCSVYLFCSVHWGLCFVLLFALFLCCCYIVQDYKYTCFAFIKYLVLKSLCYLAVGQVELVFFKNAPFCSELFLTS